MGAIFIPKNSKNLLLVKQVFLEASEVFPFRIYNRRVRSENRPETRNRTTRVVGLGFLVFAFELLVNGGGREIEVRGTLAESRRKKGAMAQGQYAYMRLQDAVLHMNERVNFYGVVAEYEQPKSTRGKGFSFFFFLLV